MTASINGALCHVTTQLFYAQSGRDPTAEEMEARANWENSAQLGPLGPWA